MLPLLGTAGLRRKDPERGTPATWPLWLGHRAPAIGRPYTPCMATKAPPSGQAKKPGKSLKEKRAEKQAKKVERSKRPT